MSQTFTATQAKDPPNKTINREYRFTDRLPSPRTAHRDRIVLQLLFTGAIALIEVRREILSAIAMLRQSPFLFHPFLDFQLTLVSPQKTASCIGKRERPVHDGIVVSRLKFKLGAFELSVKTKRLC